MKTEANVWENSRVISENPRRSRGFSPAREFSQTLPRFSTGYGGTDNMFYFFYKIVIFIVSKEKDGLLSAYCKFLQLWDSQNTLLKPFSCFIGLWKHTCRPIKTHVLSKLFYNYFRNDVIGWHLSRDYLKIYKVTQGKQLCMQRGRSANKINKDRKNIFRYFILCSCWTV